MRVLIAGESQRGHDYTWFESKEAILAYNSLFRVLKFLLPSLVGIGLFLVPISVDDKQTIVIGLLSDLLRQSLESILPMLLALLFAFSAIASSYASIFKPQWLLQHPFAKHLFSTSAVWLSLRIIGGVMCPLTVLAIGPDWIIGENTGAVAYIEMASIIFCIMIVANYLLPFLTDYGFLELVGALLTAPFKLLFRLPGRAGLDALTSWVGDSSVGTILTIRQYEAGHYSAREAAVVVTNFSAVSLPFSVVIAQMARLDYIFFPFYLSVIFCSIVAAFITPRLPPLNRVSEGFFNQVQRQQDIEDESLPLLQRAWSRAVTRAQQGPSIGAIIKGGTRNIVDIFISVLPAAMTIEFIALVIYTYSDFFYWASLPMLPLVWLLQIPDPSAVVSGSLVGFFDQFIPAIMSGSMEDPVSRFVVAGLSITQLIFIAENGTLILRSSIPLHIGQLFVIFLIRTVITLPLLVVAAHLFV
ncbi:MAG: nucleoside recognition membrane protein YjiH [Pseudohongiellaceae bacterium]